MNPQLQNSFLQTKNALQRLKEALDKPMDQDRSNVDLCIHRFEFSFELFWKLLKRILESQGEVDAKFPKSTLIAAYAGNLINNEKNWLKMLEDRNNTSHTYHQALAEEIFSRLPAHYDFMKKTFDGLCTKFKIDQNLLEQMS